MKKEKLSIVLVEPDSYKDIVELYLNCLKQNWKDCPYPIYWANQEEHLDDDLIHVINVGGDPLHFCGRLLKVINIVNTEWTLFSNADMILTNQVETDEINELLNCLDKRGGLYCCLKKIPKTRMKADPEYPHIYHMASNRAYNVGLTFGIFKTDYLRSIIKDPCWTGWQCEEYCLQLACQGKNDKSYYYDKDIGRVVHLLCKGKLIPSGKREIIRYGIDLSSLKRETLSRKESIIEAGKRFVSAICPIKLRKPIKKLISIMGYEFISKY